MSEGWGVISKGYFGDSQVSFITSYHVKKDDTPLGEGVRRFGTDLDDFTYPVAFFTCIYVVVNFFFSGNF